MINCGNQIDTQTHNKVVNIFSLLLNKPIQGVINIHPAYNSLMLSLDFDVDNPIRLLPRQAKGLT